MQTMASSKYEQASLPKLTTSKELCRRDSLSSSRTRDSGYNSDLDVSLSPLDFAIPEQDISFASFPPLPNLPIIIESSLWKTHEDFGRSSTCHQSHFTSSPALVGSAIDRKLHRTRTVSIPRSRTILESSNRDHIENKPASQDEDTERWIKDNLPARNRPQERVSSIVSLSSTSSCDMHSDTDISDDELEGGAMQMTHPTSTLKIIKFIMRKIEVNLRYVAYRQCTGGGPSSAQNGANRLSHQGSCKTSQRSGHKRKCRQEGSPPPEDDDEDGSNKRRRGSVTTTDGSEVGARFACPFHKHEPDRYRIRRTCAGPGWPTVHRMKEHLYRSHAQPIFCPICYSTFKSDKEQSNHVRLQQCQRSAPQHIEGIDRETMYTLRRRTTALRLEEDKWRDVYHVLFPDVSPADIPSPFYQCDSPSEPSRRFRRELLRRVQEELLATSEDVPAPIEQQLLQRVAHIIRRCEEDLLRYPETSATPTIATYRRSSSSSTASAGCNAPLSEHAASRPALASQSQPTFSALLADHSNPETSRHPGPALTIPRHIQTQYVPDPTVNFAPVIWGEEACDPFSLGIDWEGIFPPAPEIQHAGGIESFTALSAPMWTR